MRYYLVTYRRFIGGVSGVVFGVETVNNSMISNSEAWKSARDLAVRRMSSGWSVAVTSITNELYREVLLDIDDFGIWMLTETAIKEGA